MTRGDRDDVERVRGASDIVEVISQYVGLKPAGENMTGVCPFHRDSKPSLTVSATKQVYHCFGCGAGGDVFDFVMRAEQITFGEALRRLAARAGVPLRSGVAAAAGDKRRARLLAAVGAAEEYYFNYLRADNSYAAAARDYLRRRGLRDDVRDAWRLGLAPEGWDVFLRWATRAGFDARELAEAGLAVASKDRGGYYDRFRRRVLFPITNLAGETVAFGGRLLGEGEPKYLNSATSPLYNKGVTPYGLERHRQHIAGAGVCIVVEGYLDLLGVAQAGVENVVATCGTALSEEMARLLARYAREFVLLFDGDDAGMRAARRAAVGLLKEGARVRVASPPPGQDPFDLSLAGPDAVKRTITAAVDWFDFIIDRETWAADADRTAGVLAAIKEITPLLAVIPDELERQYWRRRVSERLGLNEASFAYPEKPPRTTRGVAVDGEKGGAERHLLQILIHYPQAAQTALAEVSLDDVEDEQVLRCLRVMGKLARRGKFSLLEILDELEEEEDRALVTSLAAVPTREEDCARAVKLAVRRVRHASLDRRIRKMKVAAQGDGLELDREELKALLEEKKRYLGK